MQATQRIGYTVINRHGDFTLHIEQLDTINGNWYIIGDEYAATEIETVTALVTNHNYKELLSAIAHDTKGMK